MKRKEMTEKERRAERRNLSLAHARRARLWKEYRRAQDEALRQDQDYNYVADDFAFDAAREAGR